MIQLRLSQQAQHNLDEIKSYTLLNWGVKQSGKYLLELNQVSLLVSQNPLIGLQRPELNNEIFSFPCRSHIIYYKFNKKQLFVLAILHKNMLPKEHLQN